MKLIMWWMTKNGQNRPHSKPAVSMHLHSSIRENDCQLLSRFYAHDKRGRLAGRWWRKVYWKEHNKREKTWRSKERKMVCIGRSTLRQWTKRPNLLPYPILTSSFWTIFLSSITIAGYDHSIPFHVILPSCFRWRVSVFVPGNWIQESISNFSNFI